MAFAKLKALLRKDAERTVDGLWDATGRFVGGQRVLYQGRGSVIIFLSSRE